MRGIALHLFLIFWTMTLVADQFTPQSLSIAQREISTNADFAVIETLNTKLAVAKDSAQRAMLSSELHGAIKTTLEQVNSGALPHTSVKQLKSDVAELNQSLGLNSSDLQYALDKLLLYSIHGDLLFVEFITTLDGYYGEFHSHEDFKALLKNYRNKNLLNQHTFSSEYERLAGSGIEGKNKRVIVELYDSYANKQVAYETIYQYELSKINKYFAAHDVLGQIGLQKVVFYLDNNKELKPINQFFVNTIDVTLGQVLLALVVFILVVLVKLIALPLIRQYLKTISGQDKGDVKKVRRIRLYQLLNDSFVAPLSILFYLIAGDLALRILFLEFESLIILMYYELLFIVWVVWTLFRFVNVAVSVYSEYYMKKYPNIRAEMINFMVTTIRLGVLIIAMLFVLKHLGYNISALLASIGIGGLAIAFASKDAVANIIGSVSIILDNVFTQGDWIHTGEVDGTVVDIGIRTTKVRTFDNAMVFVPNSYLANTSVRNWNKRRIGRRIKFQLTLEYPQKHDDVKEYMQRVLKAKNEIHQMLVDHPGVADASMGEYRDEKVNDRIINQENHFGVKKTLLVYLDTLDDSSMNILIYCFSKSVDWETWLGVQEDVLVKVMGIVGDNNLSTNFPSRTVYVRNEGGDPYQISAEPQSQLQ